MQTIKIKSKCEVLSLKLIENGLLKLIKHNS